jgi:hypothetical protein
LLHGDMYAHHDLHDGVVTSRAQYLRDKRKHAIYPWRWWRHYNDARRIAYHAHSIDDARHHDAHALHYPWHDDRRRNERAQHPVSSVRGGVRGG